jgi:hypothetical protein
MSCTDSGMVLRKFFICATASPKLLSGAKLGRTRGRFCCTVQYCLCLLARSGLLIPTQSSPDLVRSTTLEYTHPWLATPAQSTWDHAQLRTAYALHYRTLEMAATISRPPRGKRAPKTRLVWPSRPDIKTSGSLEPKVLQDLAVTKPSLLHLRYTGCNQGRFSTTF